MCIRDRSDEQLNEFIDSISKESAAESNTLIKWLREAQNKGDINNWTKLLEKDKELQRQVENLLMQECGVDELGTSNLSSVANTLKCRIILNEHSISEPSNAAPKCTIVIARENESTFRLYMKEDYLEKKQRLKEAIIEQLIAEREENYTMLEKLSSLEPVDPEMIKIRKGKITEFNNLIDQLIDLKTTGKKKTGSLLNCLKEMKRENAEIMDKLNSYDPMHRSLFREPQVTVELKKIPCMDCKESDKMIKELSCGHIICSDCIIARISDLRDTKKAFVLKCTIPYCFNILHIEDVQDVIDLSLIHICRCRRYAVCRSRWSP
eukprot:TRINITY_DN6860_c0_g2_i1.p1 TRINITY_DN6860_c0_g2~~TRINITY_DN6860_c0_g2_i1.p1  ORF type:complete len:322 (+),score=94.53 TRINITY_DN6860_c0_g2_i1:73-1038(+)